MYYDAHNHLQDDWLRPHLDRIAADVAAAGIAGMVVNGTSEADWPVVAALAARFPWVRPSFGLHPWDVGQAGPQWRDHLRRTLDAHPEAAVGEIGLDRWILDHARPDDPRLAGLRRAPLAEQLEAFAWQLDLAAARNLPVSIHCLDAWQALASALRTAPRPRCGFLLHAYGGSAELAREFAALGAYFSFNGSFLAPGESNPIGYSGRGGAQVSAGAGPVDDRREPPGDRSTPARRARARAQRYAQVFASLPLDRLLVETDAPAMPLPPGRESAVLSSLADGTRVNHPANVTAVYAELAAIRGLPVVELTRQVADNFRRLFAREPSRA